MESWELKDNYIACVMCILTGWTPEQCFDYLETLQRPRYNFNVTENDVINMIKLKQSGMTYREIGEIYGLSPDATYNRIRRFKKSV